MEAIGRAIRNFLITMAVVIVYCCYLYCSDLGFFSGLWAFIKSIFSVQTWTDIFSTTLMIRIAWFAAKLAWRFAFRSHRATTNWVDRTVNNTVNSAFYTATHSSPGPSPSRSQQENDRAWQRYQLQKEQKWQEYQARQYAGTADGEAAQNRANQARWKRENL